jgi:virginiamycin B lyase
MCHLHHFSTEHGPPAEKYSLGVMIIFLAMLFTPGAEACRPFGSYAFVEDSEGGVWFTEGDNNAVSRLSPDGTVMAYPLPTPSAEPADLALDRQGNLWFAELNGGKIGRLSPDGRIREYPLGNQDAHPWQLWVDANSEVWFLEGRKPARVGRLLTNGVIRNYILAQGWPTSMAPASDGGLWLSVLIPADTQGTDLTQATGRILHLSRDGVWRERLSRTASCPMNIISDDQGRLWFSDRCRHSIERLGHAGESLRYELPEEAFIQDMALDSEGSLWFIDNTRNLIGRIDPGKRTRTYPLPGDTGGPFAMALSRQGGIIFSETYNYNINRLNRNGVFTEQLVNVDHRQKVEKVEREGICYLRFASIIQRKEKVVAKRAAAIASASLAEEGSRGARLLRMRCLACHDLKRILLARKSDWQPTLGLMDTYRGQRQMMSLNHDERNILLEYLNTHYNIGQ